MTEENIENKENTVVLRIKKKELLRIVGAALLGLILGISTTLSGFFSPQISELDHHLAHAQLPALYEEFQCPCCDDNIGGCTCGLAKDRRDLIRNMATVGTSRREVYQFMYLYDGPDAFFDQEQAALAKTWLEEKVSDDRPILSIDPLELDLGTVSMADGMVSMQFQVKNAGLADLTITNLGTSCMCTTVALKTSDGLGPTFGAHIDENPVDWTKTLAPDEEALLVVTFDPNAHGPDAVGEIRRVITVTSDDPLQPEMEIEIVVNVVK